MRKRPVPKKKSHKEVTVRQKYTVNKKENFKCNVLLVVGQNMGFSVIEKLLEVNLKLYNRIKNTGYIKEMLILTPEIMVKDKNYEYSVLHNKWSIINVSPSFLNCEKIKNGGENIARLYVIKSLVANKTASDEIINKARNFIFYNQDYPITQDNMKKLIINIMKESSEENHEIVEKLINRNLLLALQDIGDDKVALDLLLWAVSINSGLLYATIIGARGKGNAPLSNYYIETRFLDALREINNWNGFNPIFAKTTALQYSYNVIPLGFQMICDILSMMGNHYNDGESLEFGKLMLKNYHRINNYLSYHVLGLNDDASLYGLAKYILAISDEISNREIIITDLIKCLEELDLDEDIWTSITYRCMRENEQYFTVIVLEENLTTKKLIKKKYGSFAQLDNY